MHLPIIYNEVTDDYNAGFCGDLAGLYHFYGTEGKELADKNAVIPDFNMSENAKAGYEVDENTPTGFYVTAGKAQENKAGLKSFVTKTGRFVLLQQRKPY